MFSSFHFSFLSHVLVFSYVRAVPTFVFFYLRTSLYYAVFSFSARQVQRLFFSSLIRLYKKNSRWYFLHTLELSTVTVSFFSRVQLGTVHSFLPFERCNRFIKMVSAFGRWLQRIENLVLQIDCQKGNELLSSIFCTNMLFSTTHSLSQEIEGKKKHFLEDFLFSNYTRVL